MQTGWGQCAEAGMWRAPLCRSGTPCLLLIGPEGDWTPEEQRALVEAGTLPVGLGDLRLRTETAALALLSAAQLYRQ